MKKKIYEKHYPNIVDQILNMKLEPGPPRKSFEEFLRELEEDYVFEAVPERISNAHKFILAAEKFSRDDQTSVEIIQGDHEIDAIFEMDNIFLGGPILKLFAYLLSIADEIQYLPCEKGTHLQVTYFTHELYHKGEKTRNII